MLFLRILGYTFAALALLLVLTYVFLNVHPVAWRYAREFKEGTEPTPLEGTYDGTFLAPPWSGSWRGKVFRTDGTGANRLGTAVALPFRWERIGGQVILRYDRDPNPWWMRLIEDQIVAQRDGALLGRMTLIVGPWRIPLAWFTIVPVTE